MDIEKEYSCLERNCKVYSKNLDNENEYQETLPGYCDDIYRVVKCVSHSYITSADIHYGEIKIYGKTEICLTYFNENSNLCYADFEEEFNKTINVDNLSENAFVNACATDKYTNFRVINQRRIDVHTSSNIRINVYDKAKSPCVSSCTNAKLKSERVKTANVIHSNISRIEFDEEFSIPADSLPIKRIISSDAFASLTETKIIKDKALIKASVNVTVLYTADDSDETILKTESAFQVSKIVEVSGVEETDHIVSELTIGNLFLKAKVSSGDKMNVIDVFGDLSVSSLFIREGEQNLITDGYVLNRDSDCSYSDYNCCVNGKSINDSRQLNIGFDFSTDIAEIKTLSVVLTDTAVRNNQLVSRATVTALCMTASGDFGSFSSSNDITLDIEGYEDAVAGLSVKAFDYALAADGRVDVRLTVDMNVYAFNNVNFKILSEMNPHEDFIEYPSLTVYFGKQNESVWNIAKSFSSDIDLIVKENALSTDVLDSNKILIIPRV